MSDRNATQPPSSRFTHPSLLAEILELRDRRRSRSLELFSRFPGKVLVMLTLNLPGTEKAHGRPVLEAGIRAFPFPSLVADIQSQDALWVVEGAPEAVKRTLVELEDAHPLGRLWDWDVFVTAERSLSRGELGLELRRCFLCERPAKVCSRARTHPDEEIVAFIRRTVRNWEELC